MQHKLIALSALTGLSAAYTQPNYAQFPTPGAANPITAPLNQVVPEGKPFTITWSPTTGAKVSLLLLKGPSTNVVYYSTIADSIDNTGSFTWTPDSSIPTTADATGYGIQLVVEGTGEYQYSTQIGLSAADGSDKSNSGANSVTSYGSVETAPPSGTTRGTAECGALDECPKTTVTTPCSESTVAPVVTLSTSCSESNAAITSAAHAVTAATGSGNISSPLIQPTGPVTVPSSLATIAQPGTTAAPNSGPGAGAAGNSAAAHSTGISTGGAVAQGAQLTGAMAAIAGLLSFFVL